MGGGWGRPDPSLTRFMVGPAKRCRASAQTESGTSPCGGWCRHWARQPTTSTSTSARAPIRVRHNRPTPIKRAARLHLLMDGMPWPVRPLGPPEVS